MHMKFSPPAGEPMKNVFDMLEAQCKTKKLTHYTSIYIDSFDISVTTFVFN
jgi:hypothetical protein